MSIKHEVFELLDNLFVRLVGREDGEEIGFNEGDNEVGLLVRLVGSILGLSVGERVGSGIHISSSVFSNEQTISLLQQMFTYTQCHVFKNVFG